MELLSSQSYANFRAWVPRNILPIGIRNPQSWLYYDWGPRSYTQPLICLHSLIGSAESFFPQLISLPPRGYRIISVQVPIYWTITEFCDAFHSFLDALSIKRFHVYAAGLGGFLALHYAVRRPEQVASIALTHSFLSTENLNLGIPYSPSVLKWLPDFLIRSTMRAILPKGRASLSIANAAEFAIGHTINRPRDELASRMALSITSSSVISRLHIPQTAITLIDTLDRTPPAIALSEQTAAHLPGARRALIKQGGDFPYLATPDDVNVHLVVHMRRNAPQPKEPIPVPPPALPNPLPQSAIRRREAEKRRRATVTVKITTSINNNNNEEEEATDGKYSETDRPHRTDAERETEAQAIVAATERGHIERYAFEIGRLKEFLPERDDTYLVAVILDCEGNLDLAISKALEDSYPDNFYDSIKESMLVEAREQVLIAEQEREQSEQEDDKENLPDHQSSVDLHDTESPSQRSHTIVNNTDNRAFLQSIDESHDPLTSPTLIHSEFVDHPMEPDSDASEKFEGDASTRIPASVGESGSDIMTDENSVGMRPTRRSRSSLTHIDLNDGDNELDDKNSSADDKNNINMSDGNEDDHGSESSGSKRQRRARRRSKSNDDNGDHETLVGRGPEPFDDAPGEKSMQIHGGSWMSGDGEETEGAESTQESEGKNGTTTPSGASLLEVEDNPLDLPSPDMRYGSRTQRRQHSTSGFPSSTPRNHFSRETAGNTQTGQGGLRDRSFFGWKNVFAQSSSVLVPESETVMGGSEDQSSRFDEWDTYRNGEGQHDAVQGRTDRPAVSMKNTPQANVEDATVNEENERLREWSMSAQAASKSVNR